ncbi:MAG: hypothetical protein DMG05_01285 [Acidobacteria bacterium]|nr:MAG: hypothetical protein DMG05_01285 [Acidobacteriota bacterium]
MGLIHQTYYKRIVREKKSSAFEDAITVFETLKLANGDLRPRFHQRPPSEKAYHLCCGFKGWPGSCIEDGASDRVLRF